MNNDFKIGDLVLNILSSRKAFKIEFIDKYGNCFGNKDCDCAHMEYLTKWIPKKDEWCWFWDDCTPHRPNCRQFGSVYIESGKEIYCDSEQNPYTNCEPFVNSLPLHLQ
jgi:hypothetical protein